MSWLKTCDTYGSLIDVHSLAVHSGRLYGGVNVGVSPQKFTLLRTNLTLDAWEAVASPYGSNWNIAPIFIYNNRLYARGINVVGGGIPLDYKAWMLRLNTIETAWEPTFLYKNSDGTDPPTFDYAFYYSEVIHNSRVYTGSNGFGSITRGSLWMYGVNMDGVAQICPGYPSSAALYSMVSYNNKLYAVQAGKLMVLNEITPAWELQCENILAGKLKIYNNKMYSLSNYGNGLLRFNDISGLWEQVSFAPGGTAYYLEVFQGKLYCTYGASLYIYDDIGGELDLVASPYETENTVYSLAEYDHSFYGSSDSGFLLKYIGIVNSPIPYCLFWRITTLGQVDKPSSSLLSWLLGSLGWFDAVAPSSDIITDYILRAQNLLIEQFKESVDLKTLLGIYVKQLQDIEFVLADIRATRNIDSAIGHQLDMIGDRVGEDRDFRNDDDFRSAIKFKIFLNKSNGEPETVIAALKELTSAIRVKYSEPCTATIALQYESNFLPSSNLLQQMEQIASTGVKLLITYINSSDPVFSVDGEGAFPPDDNTAGFNELGYTEGGEEVGGQMTELIT